VNSVLPGSTCGEITNPDPSENANGVPLFAPASDLFLLEQAKAGAFRMGMSLPCECTHDRSPRDLRKKQPGSGTQEKNQKKLLWKNGHEQ
jgi:hypothetical protein